MSTVICERNDVPMLLTRRRSSAWLLILGSLSWLACGPVSPQHDGPSGGSPLEAYNPEADPLVNPDPLFEPFPENNPDLADTDATLLRHLLWEPRTLNPILGYSFADFYVGGLLYPWLIRRDATMEYQPNDAYVDHFAESADHLVTTIRLKPDMKWHDGQPFTARDVRFSWEVISDGQVPAGSFKFRAAAIKDVEIVDELTVRCHHRTATTTHRFNLGFPIVPEHIFGIPQERSNDPTLSRSDYYNRYNRQQPIGGGPYRFVEWITNDRIVLERWDDFHYILPRFKRMVFKVQPDRNVSLMLFKKGELDEIEFTPQQFVTQTNDENYRAVGVKGYAPKRMLGIIAWNVDGSNPFFSDERVRVAMCHAFDTDRALRVATYGLYRPTNGIFDKEHWCHNARVQRLPFDLEKAARLLDNAGWMVSEDDGWRYKVIAGQTVRFHFELLISTAFDSGLKMTNVFRDDLRKIGVKFDLRPLETVAFDSRTLKREFQALVSVLQVTHDPDMWRNFLHSDEIEAGRNYFGYRDERVDELFDLTRTTFARDERAEQFREIQLRVYDAQPMLAMWEFSMIQGFSNRLRGVRFSPAGIFLFDPGVTSWWKTRETAR